MTTTSTSSRTDALLGFYGRRNSNSSDSSTLSEETFPLPDSGSTQQLLTALVDQTENS